jgi:hypothetical protein
MNENNEIKKIQEEKLLEIRNFLKDVKKLPYTERRDLSYDIFDIIKDDLDESDIIDDLYRDTDDLLNEYIYDNYIIDYVQGLSSRRAESIVKELMEYVDINVNFEAKTVEDEFKLKALAEIYKTKELSDIENFLKSK